MLTQLPAETQNLLTSNPEQAAVLWAWVSQVHYEQVLEQAGPDHLLVRVKNRFDFTVVEQASVGYRLYKEKQGNAATYTLGQLCRGVVLKAVKHWSYEQTATEIAANSLLRWFVGYDLKQRTFSDTTLFLFESWLKVQHGRLIFDEILKVIDEDFPAEASSVQIGDTFALLSRAREQSRTELLRNASRKVLAYLPQVTARGYQQVLVAMPGELLFGKVGEPKEWWLEKSERDALEVRTALAAKQTLAWVEQALVGVVATQELTYLALQRWLGLLEKILQDEFTFEQEPNGAWSKASVREQHKKGSYALGSTVDTAATYRQHGKKSELGYNGHVAATPRFVREINAGLGAAPDSTGVANLAAQQLEHLGIVPPKLIYDRAAGMPKIFHDVAKASEGQTQLVARLIDYGKSSERFGPSDFTLGEDGSLTCPNGQSSSKFYPSGSADGWNYRFTAKQCTDCPLWQRCRGEKTVEQPAVVAAAYATPTEATPVVSAASDTPTAKGTARRQPPPPKAKSKARSPKADTFRQVFISEYIYQQRAALAYTQTAQFKLDMKLRPHIERIIACLVRYNGARQATGYGLLNADYQLRMAAVAFNLKSWHRLTLEKEHAQRYKPLLDST